MAPAFPRLPPRIGGLADVALNISWSWNRDARALFHAIDSQLWTRCRHDAVRLLRETSAERFAQCTADPGFVERYDGLMQGNAAKLAEVGWFAGQFPALRGKTVAYFCAEFAFHHTIPIYSGGLGVLAGDHCKSASDLGVPLVGVGILYRSGYFAQRIRPDGWQEDADDTFPLHESVLQPVEGPGGRSWLAVVRTEGRDVHLRAWKLCVGRINTYLLDTDIEENHPDDRALLSRLYSGGPALRLKQEWLLGVGGVRVLRALGIEPAAWHANEGHVAFMLIERVRELVAGGMPFAKAVQQVRATSTFTTHTPVPAGHDVFPVERLAACTGPVWEEMGIERDAFMRIGHHPLADDHTFHMTAAAIRLSRRVGAVARSHAAVTRKLWAPLWPGRTEEAVPVSYVTNGVHLATWMANDVMTLLDEQLGEGWEARTDQRELWDTVLGLDDAELWRVHRSLKRTLLDQVREQSRRELRRAARGAEPIAGSGVLLDADALTIGFARRFATYKRASLLFHDVDRLLRLVNDAARPVQVIFAGKAHPADKPGQEVLHAVYEAARESRFEGRIAFVENYDMHLAQLLVQGVDLWLNLPLPPLEASGTSGMKAALNGVPQLSTADGWWAEGFDGNNGWTLTPQVGEPDTDVGSALALYDLLEREVVPAYYDQNHAGVSARWLRIMKHSLRAAGAHFTARRMLMEYVNDFYVPSMLGEGPADDPPVA